MSGDAYAVEGGNVVIHPVEHASFVMTLPGMVDLQRPRRRRGEVPRPPAARP